MIFRNPLVLLLLPISAAALLYFFKKRDISSSIKFSAKGLTEARRITPRLRMKKALPYLSYLVISLFILALARPQKVSEEVKIHTEGIDIVLAIDSSGSMQAEDFTIARRRENRLEVVKKVVVDFIRERKSDRIGMVTFAGRAYTVCPLTLDYDWLIENLKRVKIGAIEDGTAIGSAIASSLNRLEDTEAKSKIIILLTDGINNAGKIPPLTAADAAAALGIKIYTIGAGTKGPVPYPMRGPWGKIVYQNIEIKIDDDMLKKIADTTGGKYFRATDTKSLVGIYEEINRLEKTQIEETGFTRYEELFGCFLSPGLLLLLLQVFLSNTALRKLP